MNNKLKAKPTVLPLLMVVALLSVFIKGCTNGAESDCMFNIEKPCIPEGNPHRSLADYGLFRGDIRDLEPVEGLLPFDLNTPLFSDYAEKLRMVYVPHGTSVIYNDREILSFPVGSVLVKNFFYDYDMSNTSAGRTILETRLLIRQAHGWTAETYVWNEEQTEAVLQQTGDSKEVTWIDKNGIQQKVNYLIPTKNDCKTCHSHDNSLIPVGPKVRNLNKTYPYPDGEENQLIRWEQAVILENRPALDKIPEAPVWSDSSTGTLNGRARIYLDVNCGNCHHPSGSANNTGLFLNLEEENEFNLGIYKIPISSGSGSGGLKYDIVPGNPDSSIMIFRMESVEPQERMPELGRTLVHKEGVALIREWVKNLECTSCE